MKPGAEAFAWIPFTFGVHGFPEDVSRFTTFGCASLFERAGFEIVRIDESLRGAFLQMRTSCTSSRARPPPLGCAR